MKSELEDEKKHILTNEYGTEEEKDKEDVDEKSNNKK